MKVTERQIKLLRNYFSTKPVIKAFVFGSAVRGDADFDSDLDILVELDYTQHIGLEFVAMQQELEDILHCPIDLVTEKALSPHIKPMIEREKVQVYER